MSGDILIRNGRICDPASNVDENGDILVRDGAIAAIGKNLKNNGGRVVDASGLVISPGLIDLHVHLREPGFEYKETIASGAMAAVAGGFTSICCMANTDPVNDNGTVTRSIVEKAEEAGLARVYPIGAVSRGLGGKELAEIGEMKEAGIVAISDDGRCVTNPRLLRSAMEYASMFGLVVVEHCEDESAKGGHINEGKISAMYGIKGIPSTAEDSIVARDIALAGYLGLPVHIAHISTKGAVEAVRVAKAKGIKVTCEAAPHHFAFTEKMLKGCDANFKMNPPLRMDADVNAIKAGLADGTIDAIATDHAPHAAWEKEMELDVAPFGVVGLETALAVSMGLVENGTLSLSGMLALFTCRPAAIFNLPGGTLGKGAPADICMFDPEKKWTVNPDLFHSKGRNTPFAGRKLKGMNLLTMVGGRIVYNPANL